MRIVVGTQFEECYTKRITHSQEAGGEGMLSGQTVGFIFCERYARAGRHAICWKTILVCIFVLDAGC